eukprot:CAMPEP_0173378892 /NCGR_PEP_ID=MMETSP1356-20130122/2011_1 /TAXON_ID=77927 ORGANISM="Hemiselmis virescens, Strain PCC157" /NCGR_SAMPLE_ID=MMETSP1356 /ASSEMBLY_ACC=CAM_ASM_000847 /LENGTH=81 /DNA_ID=CAMNT_0014332119 /DNA_START=77 /DNA_END=318 /DNA_ORIENTATION=-
MTASEMNLCDKTHCTTAAATCATAKKARYMAMKYTPRATKVPCQPLPLSPENSTELTLRAAPIPTSLFSLRKPGGSKISPR